MSQAITDWEVRSDVLYHFYAFQYFDKSTGGIDFINLDDADVEYFNRIADMTRGLGIQYKLAKYLKDFEIYDSNANTHRTRLLHHVRTYNFTQHPRRRFYLLNLSVQDAKFLENMAGIKKEGVNGLPNANPNVKAGLVWASDGCEFDIVTSGQDEDVEGEVRNCLAQQEKNAECKGKELSVTEGQLDMESKMGALEILENNAQNRL